MSRGRSKTLTEAEFKLMRLLWRLGECSVGDLVGAMPSDAPLAYTSVLTTMRILETKGYVEHRQQGRAFLYRPSVGEEDARESEVRHIIGRFFGNSRQNLLMALLGEADVSAAEIESLKRAIAKSRGGATVQDRGGELKCS